MPDYSLSAIEAMLADVPRPDFRARLRQELHRRASMTTTIIDRIAPTRQVVTPMLRVRDAARAIEFYANAFGARELMRFDVGGRVAHAELEIGNSLVYLGEEAADAGYPSPQTLGGSPVAMHLYVDDADAAVARAVAAGARVWTPVTDQFYGDRSGQIVDPFGFAWTLAARTEDMSVEEMYRRFAALQPAPQPGPPTYIREGFRTVTPYLIVGDVPALIEFVARAFDAEETGRFVGAGLHAEVRIGDSMLMIGGGAPPEHPYGGQQWTTAFHIYVKDTDAVYERALRAGATSIGEPQDMEYGERSAGVKDAVGNVWYIATAHGDRYVPAGLQTVNVYLHPLRAEPVIAFLTRAFGATDVQKFASSDGVVHHASVKVGDTVIEMGEAHGPYQPMPTRFYLYVPDCDSLYRRALESGATSVTEPADQPYGDRVGGVVDVFGNQWYLATRIAEQGR
jgi:PhnB protein